MYFSRPDVCIDKILQEVNARFPGQWFQLEAGWHRHYDPTIGRYTQPDPLGFVDGPSVYAYVKAQPLQLKDFDGRNPGAGAGFAGGTAVCGPVCGTIVAAAIIAAPYCIKKLKKWIDTWPPPPDNFNCKPGLCCLEAESEPMDGWGGKMCHYRCGADYRPVTERQSGKHAPCREWIFDEFNQGLLGGQ
ncbi:MAG: RHS repeat-associated core domain-containing protein [Hyphomicrobiaceae bacterium]